MSITDVKVFVKYRAGHITEFEYGKTALFCPNCGTCGSVWKESGFGDYYIENHVCIACSQTFTIQGPSEPNEYDNQILTAIKKELK